MVARDELESVGSVGDGLVQACLHCNYMLTCFSNPRFSSPTSRTHLSLALIVPVGKAIETRQRPLCYLWWQTRVACSYSSPSCRHTTHATM